jgi:hypothetical protein
MAVISKSNMCDPWIKSGCRVKPVTVNLIIRGRTSVTMTI